MKPSIKESSIVALTSFFLLSFFQPFGLEQMGEGRMPFIIVISLSAFLSSLISFTIVQGLSKQPFFNLRLLLAFHAINTPLLASVILSVNTCYTWSESTVTWYCTSHHFSFVNLIVVCLQVMLVSVFVFVIQIYRYRTSRLAHELEEVRALNVLLEQRQTLATASEDMEQSEETDEREAATCILRGNTSNAVFEVDPSCILFAESMSNYASVSYLDNDTVRKVCLRITMKQLVDSLQTYPYLMQCHRAFLINLNFVQGITGRPSTGFMMEVFSCERPIPVSRTYTAEVHQRLMGR